MIIPSIDLQSGNAVQLIGGEELAINAGDPFSLAQTFRLAGEIAVIDLDAAMGNGTNRALIEDLVKMAACRVGGGIRTYEAAVKWLDAGAKKIILGTAAEAELLSKLPKDRVIAALDARDGKICIKGWKQKTTKTLEDGLRELQGLVGGFLITFIEKEGRLGGIDKQRVQELQRIAGNAKLTIAGGIQSVEEIAYLDSLGIDSQVGMALYNKSINLADAISAPLAIKSPGKLWPTVVSDASSQTLGLAWSSAESLREAVRLKQGVYQSRRRGLWIKGASSGNTQELLQINLDCDRDTLQFVVNQQGNGFCHNGTYTCFGSRQGINALWQKIKERKAHAPEGSYTSRLFHDLKLLKSKVLEEANELINAEDSTQLCSEAADLFYFAFVYLAQAGLELSDVENELSRRMLRLTRRPGNAKQPLS